MSFTNSVISSFNARNAYIQGGQREYMEHLSSVSSWPLSLPIIEPQSISINSPSYISREWAYITDSII
jgi:hypothetical protein